MSTPVAGASSFNQFKFENYQRDFEKTTHQRFSVFGGSFTSHSLEGKSSDVIQIQDEIGKFQRKLAIAEPTPRQSITGTARVMYKDEFHTSHVWEDRNEKESVISVAAAIREKMAAGMAQLFDRLCIQGLFATATEQTRNELKGGLEYNARTEKAFPITQKLVLGTASGNAVSLSSLLDVTEKDLRAIRLLFQKNNAGPDMIPVMLMPPGLEAAVSDLTGFNNMERIYHGSEGDLRSARMRFRNIEFIRTNEEILDKASDLGETAALKVGASALYGSNLRRGDSSSSANVSTTELSDDEAIAIPIWKDAAVKVHRGSAKVYHSKLDSNSYANQLYYLMDFGLLRWEDSMVFKLVCKK